MSFIQANEVPIENIETTYLHTKIIVLTILLRGLHTLQIMTI
jgi:hypothetical protein